MVLDTMHTLKIPKCIPLASTIGLPWWLYRKPRFTCWVKKIPWRRQWLPTPVFLPGEFHGKRHLAGLSIWVIPKSDSQIELPIWYLPMGVKFMPQTYMFTDAYMSYPALLRNLSSVQFSSVTQLCLTLCDPMDYSMPDVPVQHHLLELTQTHVHWVDDAIQPSHPVIPFSSCLQSFPASGSFPMSQYFTSGGQSIGVSASASVLPMNI